MNTTANIGRRSNDCLQAINGLRMSVWGTFILLAIAIAIFAVCLILTYTKSSNVNNTTADPTNTNNINNDRIKMIRTLSLIGIGITTFAFGGSLISVLSVGQSNKLCA